MNKEKYIPRWAIDWAKHSRNSILGKAGYNRLRRRVTRKKAKQKIKEL